MLDKLKQIPKHPVVTELRDIRVVGFVVFAVLVLLVSWSSANVIQSNYELQKKIAKLQQQNTVTDLENQNLKLRNEYLKTDQYLELTARRQFGLAAAGEKLVLVPKEVAMRYVSAEPVEDVNKNVVEQEKPFYQRNFEAWMDFFFRQ
jgi:cell division protein FtsB